MYQELENNLKKNTKILTQAFSKWGLKILQYSYKSVCEYKGDDNADCYLYLELASIGKKGVEQNEQMELNLGDGNIGADDPDNGEIDVRNWLDTSIEVVVNVYDAAGEIVLSENQVLRKEEFDGYDTLKFALFYDDNLLNIAKSAKVFCRKYK